MIDTLKTLCYLSGVSGAEDEVRDYILERVSPHCERVKTDVLGNLMVFKRGKRSSGRRLMLCAHMDEVGLIITGITDEGLLRFATVGGIDRRVLLGKRVFVGGGHAPGVIGVKSNSFEDAAKDTVPKIESMYIDIGAGGKREAEKHVKLGDCAQFDDRVVEFGEGFIKAKAIDDRVGCACLIKLIESELPVDCWFAFTVQEEVGTRGAHTAAFSLEPELALIIEGTTAADLPGVDESKQICKLGGGAVVPFMDGGTLYDRELYETLTELAIRRGIPWQTKNLISGGTDAAAIQRSRAGVRVAGIAVPVRNIHSPSCVVKVSDCEALYNLAAAFFEEAEW